MCHRSLVFLIVEEITIGVDWSSNRIGDIGGIDINSNVFEILDACVIAFESTMELCMTRDEGDSMYGEEWEEGAELGIITCESAARICGMGFGGVVYSIFFGFKMFSILEVLELFSVLEVLELFLLLLLLLSFWIKRNSRILVFLFKGLFFLITSLGLSILINSEGFVRGGLLNANVVFFVFILCFDKSSRFFLINSESTGGVCDNGSLVVNTVWSRGSGVGNVILISFGLGDGVLSSKLFISVISFYILFLYLGVGVLKILVSIFSI
jgi:hypothetical protein